MGSPVGTTYSFVDLVGVLTSPLLDGPLQMVGGNIGLGSISIEMLTDRMDTLSGTDGVVMPSYIPGLSGKITVEVQQTSALHHALLDLFNAISTAADGGDLSDTFGTVISLRTILDGSGHLLSGVGFQKIPNKPYAAKGQNITWTLIACEVVNQ